MVAAQYDSFAKDPGLIVSVTYDSQHAVERMEIVSSTPRVDRRPAPSIDFSAADRLVAEVVPADLRGGMPANLEEVMGRNRVEQIQYAHLTTSRHFVGSDLTSVTVVWH